MSKPRSCWAPYPLRPMVNLALVREFRYIYATVSPWDGKLISTVSDKMDTFNMNIHLNVVSRKIRKRFLIMVADGAASHWSKNLRIPNNIALIKLPPYSPELNPTEQIWRILRSNYFGNKDFTTLDEAICQARDGLAEMAADKGAVKRLTNWPWISAISNAY